MKTNLKNNTVKGDDRMAVFLMKKQAIELMNVSRITLLRWDEKGMINPARLESGHRRYKRDEIEKF